MQKTDQQKINGFAKSLKFLRISEVVYERFLAVHGMTSVLGLFTDLSKLIEK